MTCCDLFYGQHNGPHHVIHEEVIKPDFDDEKAIEGMGLHGPRHEMPAPFGPQFGHYFPKPNYHKKCLHPFPSSYPSSTYWPPQAYRKPVYRPKIFYKPLFFG